MSSALEVEPRPTDRRSRLWLVAAAALVVLVAVLAYLFQPWRAFTTVTVVEAVPSVAAPSPSGAPQAPAPSVAATSPAPAQGPSVLLKGSFVSQAHETSGTASVLRLPDGSRVLRLEGLRTSDGPDLKVWLTAAPATAAGAQQVDADAYRSLGDLKGNVGDQNYVIPADVDLAALHTVSIWCARFSVSFGAAALE